MHLVKRLSKGARISCVAVENVEQDILHYRPESLHRPHCLCLSRNEGRVCIFLMLVCKAVCVEIGESSSRIGDESDISEF